MRAPVRISGHPLRSVLWHNGIGVARGRGHPPVETSHQTRWRSLVNQPIPVFVQMPGIRRKLRYDGCQSARQE